MTELRKQINNIVEDHQACLTLAKSMNGNEVYEGTTATAEDIKEGKTAYSNGEKITGALQVSNNNAMITDYSRTGAAIFEVKWYIQHLDFTGLQLNLLNTNKSACSGMFNSYYELISVKGLNLTDMTSMKNMYYCCYQLETPCVVDTSKVTDMSQMFGACYVLKIAPEMNTDNVTNMYGMFDGDKELITVPVYNASNVTDMGRMFSNCNNLSDESLNNILAMCITATKMTNKTLINLGISSAQATRCQSLSNYGAFVAAGWTTGY